jgi:hypothetical protein
VNEKTRKRTISRGEAEQPQTAASALRVGWWEIGQSEGMSEISRRHAVAAV